MYEGKDVLDIMSKYAVNRNNSIEEFIVRHFRLGQINGHRRILEFGAGTGEFLNRFSRYSQLSTYAVEIDEAYVSTLSRTHVTYRSLEEVSEQMDFVFAIDVLEHIQDDEGILRVLFAKLKQNGLLLIYVPARPELYSRFDKAIGHYRRYRLPEMKKKVLAAGFSIRVARYDDFLGYFAALYNKITTNGSLNAQAVKLYDRIFVPISRAFESVIKPPFGKNILLVAEKM